MRKNVATDEIASGRSAFDRVSRTVYIYVACYYVALVAEK